VAEAVEWLESVLPADDLRQIAAMKEDDLIDLHFGLGMYVRNSLDLWHNEALVEDSGAFEVDGASAAIIERLWRKLRADRLRPATGSRGQGRR